MKAKLKSLLRLLLLILSLLSVKESHAEDIVVGNFKCLPTDQTAINSDTIKQGSKRQYNRTDKSLYADQSIYAILRQWRK